MNVDRIVFWIRLLAWAALDFFAGSGDRPPEDEETGDRIAPWFKPERIQVWIVIVARAALNAVNGVEPPVERSAAVGSGRFWPWFKPERIQFWVQLIARFVLAVIDELGGSEEAGSEEAGSEETGKSGERSNGPAPSGAAASEEVDNPGV